jgi:surfactin synthase thioesterase subunit
MFTGWEDPLRPNVEVCALQLPGSGSRRDEPPIGQWEPLVETVAEQLLDYLDRPFALFGRGSGGLLAFETARFVQSRFGLAPVHLFLAVCPVPSAAPHSPTSDGQAASGPDQTSEPYPVAPRPPLDCPITVVAEEGETSLGRESLHDWSQHTTGGFQSVCLPDPITHPAARDRMLEIVARELEKHSTE